MEATWSPPTDEWIKRLWYRYTTDYYSATKKEQIWVNSSEAAESRACYTEWSKSEEEQISYINAYAWNLEKQYWWTYLKSSSRDTAVEKRLVDPGMEGECGMNWENSMEIHTLPYVKQIDSPWELAVWRGELNPALSENIKGWGGVGWGGRWEGSSGSRDMYTLMAEPYWYMAETNTTLESNDPPIKHSESFFKKQSFCLR